jgi:hypothetical protein
MPTVGVRRWPPDRLYHPHDAFRAGEDRCSALAQSVLDSMRFTGMRRRRSVPTWRAVRARTSGASRPARSSRPRVIFVTSLSPSITGSAPAKTEIVSSSIFAGDSHVLAPAWDSLWSSCWSRCDPVLVAVAVPGAQRAAARTQTEKVARRADSDAAAGDRGDPGAVDR